MRLKKRFALLEDPDLHHLDDDRPSFAFVGSAGSAAGELVFWAGNIAIHSFTTDFVRRVASQADALLPYHASAKQIPLVNSVGQTVAPEEPNGYKLERFVFDALPAAEGVSIVEVRPSEEFAPIKNAKGKDSPASVRKELDQQYREALAAQLGEAEKKSGVTAMTANAMAMRAGEGASKTELS